MPPRRRLRPEDIVPTVKRGPRERKPIPADLKEFWAEAESTDRPRWKPRRASGPSFNDKPGRAMPGVANPDARLVYDARVAALLASGADGEALPRLLAEAVLIGLWRGKRIVGFDAFAENVLGLEPKRARELAHEGAKAWGVPLEPLDESTIAAWIRAEGALLEESGAGRVGVRFEDGVAKLELVLDPKKALRAFSALGRRGERLPQRPPQR